MITERNHFCPTERFCWAFSLWSVVAIFQKSHLKNILSTLSSFSNLYFYPSNICDCDLLTWWYKRLYSVIPPGYIKRGPVILKRGRGHSRPVVATIPLRRESVSCPLGEVPWPGKRSTPKRIVTATFNKAHGPCWAWRDLSHRLPFIDNTLDPIWEVRTFWLRKAYVSYIKTAK